MNELGNKYALAALKDRRARIAGEIIDLERKLRHQRESLVHVDATLRLLDPDIDIAAIPNKRLRRVKLFRHGELARMIRDALRQANGKAISAHDIVSTLIKSGGHDESARKALTPRVRGNLAYLQRTGAVAKTGDQREARWRLA